jgi:hypothetical protein
MIGILAISGSEAIKFRNLIMDAFPSINPSSKLTSKSVHLLLPDGGQYLMLQRISPLLLVLKIF